MPRLTCILSTLLFLCGCIASQSEAPKPEPVVSTPEEETPTEAEAISPVEGFTQTKSGLQYKIVKPGDGKAPTTADTVVCHYRGTLDNGKEFDSSYQRNEPAEFPLSGVIAGWTEGLQLIKEGGEIDLVIPSRLGYGAGGFPPDIPPNSRLHFKVELIKVK